MKRHKHSLSHYKLLTTDMGKLVPITCFEVLPGDSVQQATSVLLRVSPLLAPVMHPVQVRIHHWFVPHRLVWDGWEDFITGGPDGEGGSSGAFPTVTAHATNGFDEGSLPDYLGVPTGSAAAGVVVSALPIRSYNMIFNEYYRDQDLVSELSEDQIVVQNVAWEKDYFTSSRPWPQKGPDVTLPLGAVAPVKGIQVASKTWPAGAGVTGYESGGPSAGATIGANNGKLINSAGGVDYEAWVTRDAGNLLGSGTDMPGVYADLTSATAANVNDVRLAFALQRYQEARARYGSRYTEYLRYLGVRSSDARLQRPEYLGGGKQTIAFSEVLQTGPDAADEGVASLKGHGIAAARSRRYRRYFEEHGVVISLLSVRPRTMYANHLPRMWSRRTKEDYWQKELEQIGQQEVYSREIYAESDANGGNAVFGYQDRYAEYKHLQSQVAGEFRSTLNYWHMARIFASQPTLNGSFVTSDPTKRINAVTSEDVLWIMTSHSIQARRLVTRGSGSRIM